MLNLICVQFNGREVILILSAKPLIRIDCIHFVSVQSVTRFRIGTRVQGCCKVCTVDSAEVYSPHKTMCQCTLSRPEPLYWFSQFALAKMSFIPNLTVLYGRRRRPVYWECCFMSVIAYANGLYSFLRVYFSF